MVILRAISRIVYYSRYYRRGQAFLRFAAGAVLAVMLSLPQLAAATTVRMETTLGTIDIELYDDQAPKTVTNFLRYAGRDDYTTNGIIHRSVPGFVIQGGGYTYVNYNGQPFYIHVPEDPPVQNEFSPSRSNVRGTIAMAKLGGNPDSATSEWFFNLADNSANLDNQNGGFTVFGRVLATGPGTGMDVVDAIVALPLSNQSAVNGAFGTLPVINYNSTTGLQPSNLVMVTSIPNVKATITQYGTTSAYAADVDMTFSSASTVPAVTETSWLTTFTPPPKTTVQFNDEISTFILTGTIGPAGRVVTLYHGANASVNRYYAYGPTPDNATPHWYDFTFDGTTGAEIVGGKILLHFVDGLRGDDDLTVNNSITHSGAPVLMTDINLASSKSTGCSITTEPSQPTNNGDWVMISMFLTFVAFVRRRTRR